MSVSMPAEVEDGVPFGTELFVIVPEDQVSFVRKSKERLKAHLRLKFPQYDFMFGHSAEGNATRWAVIRSAGKVGDGWKKARPVVAFDVYVCREIIGQIRGFVAGEVGKPN